jgi:multiple sugar transport system ATP-binding protein
LADLLLKNITKRFDRVTAVDNITLEIRDREFVTLLGPSGCGKTTTLNLIAGLEHPDDGQILIDGEVVNRKSPRDRNVAMAFQNYALYPHKNVFENLAFPLRARGRDFSAKEIEDRVRATASLLDIDTLLDRMPRELSGGQQQRVSIGRCLVRDPTVFLMDEPLSNLDARLRLRMRTELKELHTKTAGTIVYVTHDQAEAMTLSTKIALFNAGRVLQVGAPEELYNQPKNLFVANFLGEREINQIGVDVTNGQSEGMLRGPGFEIKVIQDRRDHIKRNRLLIGVRAEDVVLRDKDSDRPGVEVVLIEPMGSHQFVHLILNEQDTRLVCKIESERKASVGDRVAFSFKRIFLFDETDGTCITGLKDEEFTCSLER